MHFAPLIQESGEGTKASFSQERPFFGQHLHAQHKLASCVHDALTVVPLQGAVCAGRVLTEENAVRFSLNV